MNQTIIKGDSRNQASLVLDLSFGLGYGLFYQPIIVSSEEFKFDSTISKIHRRLKRAKQREMRS